MLKSYNELKTLPTFDERFEYLKMDWLIGEDTFGKYRYVYQEFLRSIEWRKFRNGIIVRDYGGDLGLKDFPIAGTIIIHHINPITLDDLLDGSSVLLDPNNVISVSDMTHKVLHYGGKNPYKDLVVVRFSGDTCPWKTANVH